MIDKIIALLIYLRYETEFKSKSNIPKVIFQTSKEKIPLYVQKMIKDKSKGWKYKYFSDKDIINFFIDNPLKEFPKIINKFNSFKNGAHKADLFRYYYLYIKGGVFIDSDAILNKNIESIIEDYSFVSVKSIVPNTLFNGFIATEKKNIIIYNALKKIYKTKNKQLNKDYHLICNQLFNIYNEYKNKNTILLNEVHINKYDNICVVTLDKFNHIALTHFAWSNKIPRNFNY